VEGGEDQLQGAAHIKEERSGQRDRHGAARRTWRMSERNMGAFRRWAALAKALEVEQKPNQLLRNS
jgi:hypothetical protein